MRKEVASDIRAVFNAPSLEEAQRLLGLNVEKYAKTARALSSWMASNLHEGLTVFALPEAHRKRLKISNHAERVNKELKRKTRVIGIFPNRAALLRVSSELLRERSDQWATEKTYLPLGERV